MINKLKSWFKKEKKRNSRIVNYTDNSHKKRGPYVPPVPPTAEELAQVDLTKFACLLKSSRKDDK